MGKLGRTPKQQTDMICGMIPNSTRSFAVSAIGGSALFLFLAFSAYIAGYFLLPNKDGLYQGEWQFEMFKPAMYAQRWITRQEVSSGCIYSDGMHRSITLSYPPLDRSRRRSLPLPISGDAPPGMPTEMTRP